MRRISTQLVRYSVALLMLGGVLVSAAKPVYADVNDFTITHFSADETLSRTDKQGSLHIQETIDVLFTDNNHGLLRSIPETYKDHSLRLQNVHVSSPTHAPIGLSRSSSNGNTVLRIGDPNRTITGAQTYVITYDVANVITFYDDHDELYWDVNGDQWQQPTDAVDYTLHLPAGIRLGSEQPHCFTGSFGTTVSNCLISSENGVLKASAAGLYGYQTLTIVAGFQKGYFTPQTTLEKMQPYIVPVLMITVLPLLTLAISWRIWWARGRDPKGRGTIVPEYTPPKDVTATEAGSLIDFKVDNRDITAAIIDLALRGHIRILEERHERTLAPDQTNYQLELLKNDAEGRNYYENDLISALFPSNTVGDKIDISTAKNKFSSTAKTIRDHVEDSLKMRGYYRTTPKSYVNAATGLAGVGFIMFYFLGILHFLTAGILLSIIIAWLFVRAMPSRTQLGVDAKEQLLGLKLYIETAEKDRIAMLQSPNAPYAPTSTEPVKTVELFEKLLPYAMVLGVEKAWAKQFENIYEEPPGWYAGNWSTFNSLVLVDTLSGGFQNNFNTAFTAPSSSGSSGFGGGGFSGGGGGGGGGGGW
jgi:uncharacterized membrane protein